MSDRSMWMKKIRALRDAAEPTMGADAEERATRWSIFCDECIAFVQACLAEEDAHPLHVMTAPCGNLGEIFFAGYSEGRPMTTTYPVTCDLPPHHRPPHSGIVPSTEAIPMGFRGRRMSWPKGDTASCESCEQLDAVNEQLDAVNDALRALVRPLTESCELAAKRIVDVEAVAKEALEQLAAAVVEREALERDVVVLRRSATDAATERDTARAAEAELRTNLRGMEHALKAAEGRAHCLDAPIACDPYRE